MKDFQKDHKKSLVDMDVAFKNTKESIFATFLKILVLRTEFENYPS